MNKYQITQINGDKSTYHADNILAAMKKFDLWADSKNIVEVKKIGSIYILDEFNQGDYLDIEAYKGRMVRIFFDHQPREWPSRDHPGCEESWDITSVCWCDTKSELTESERCLLEENYGPLNEYLFEHINDDRISGAEQ